MPRWENDEGINSQVAEQQLFVALFPKASHSASLPITQLCPSYIVVCFFCPLLHLTIAATLSFVKLVPVSNQRRLGERPLDVTMLLGGLMLSSLIYFLQACVRVNHEISGWVVTVILVISYSVQTVGRHVLDWWCVSMWQGHYEE